MDRRKDAITQKVEILALRIKGRTDILQNGISHLVRLTSLNTSKLNSGLITREIKAIGQPASIRGPCQTTDTMSSATIQHLRCPTFQINHNQLIAMIGDSHNIING